MKLTELVSVNGKISKPEDAVISVFDRGFIYGDGIYEVVRSYDRVFFEMEAHIERLFRSAEMIDMDLGKSPRQIIEDIYKVYSHSENPNVYMRIQVSRGTSHIGLHPKNVIGGPNFVIWIRKLDSIDPKYYDKGLDLVTTQRLRNSKKALDPNVKSGNYLNNVLGYFEAIPKNADDAILLNSEGLVTEATTSNIFMVKNGEVLGAPDDFDILHGITRAVLRKVGRRIGVEILDQGFSARDLENADEAFITSSLKEVMPVWRVNGKTIKTAPGPLTLRLAADYKKYVEEYKAQARKTHPKV